MNTITLDQLNKQDAAIIKLKLQVGKKFPWLIVNDEHELLRDFETKQEAKERFDWFLRHGISTKAFRIDPTGRLLEDHTDEFLGDIAPEEPTPEPKKEHWFQRFMHFIGL